MELLAARGWSLAAIDREATGINDTSGYPIYEYPTPTLIVKLFHKQRCLEQVLELLLPAGVSGDERDDFLLHPTDKSSRAGRINEPGPLIVYSERREVTVNIAPAINVPSKGYAPPPTNDAVLIMRFVIVKLLLHLRRG
jgi:hypothetical protein